MIPLKIRRHFRGGYKKIVPAHLSWDELVLILLYPSGHTAPNYFFVVAPGVKRQPYAQCQMKLIILVHFLSQ